MFLKGYSGSKQLTLALLFEVSVCCRLGKEQENSARKRLNRKMAARKFFAPISKS